MKTEIKFTIDEFNTLSELEPTDQELVEASLSAAKRAYAPYSKFNVGAAVRLTNGEIVEGNNQENAAYPSGLCAERVACFYANSRYPTESVLAIAICASNIKGLLPIPIPPCGSCRQVLLETEARYGTDIKVILYGEQKIKIIQRVKDLLPIWFDGEALL